MAKHPDVQIIQTLSDMIKMGDATTKLQSALAARAGDIDGIIATGFNPTVAAASLLTEWNKDPTHKYIHFVGIDTDSTRHPRDPGGAESTRPSRKIPSVTGT